VEEVIRSQFKLAADFALTDDMGPDDVPGWDSLSWIDLLGAIEERFDIRLDLDQAAALETIGQIKGVVAR
jgi:acyl carrier protein